MEYEKKADMIISAFYNNITSEIVAKLTNANTGKAVSGAKVQVDLNGIDKTVKTDSKGQLKVSTAEVISGNYTATVSYKGNSKYNPASETIDITSKADIIISPVYDAYNNELMAILTNESTGKAISRAKVQVNLNGKTTKVE